MLQRIRMLGPQRVSHVYARQSAIDDPHDSVIDDPREQTAQALDQIAAILSTIDRNLEAMTQAVVALARQQPAQAAAPGQPLANRKQANSSRPDRSLPAGANRSPAVAVISPEGCGDAVNGSRSSQPRSDREMRAPPKNCSV